MTTWGGMLLERARSFFMLGISPAEMASQGLCVTINGRGVGHILGSGPETMPYQAAGKAGYGDSPGKTARPSALILFILIN